jgi:hypothetical protein
VSRTVRCAPFVEAGMILASVVRDPDDERTFLASVTIGSRIGEERWIVQAHGRGRTMARAMGAAENEAARQMRRRESDDREAAELAAAQVGLFEGTEGAREV